jgi:hypothetical protein
MDWQPIDTAPKNGSYVMLYDDGMMRLGMVLVAVRDRYFEAGGLDGQKRVGAILCGVSGPLSVVSCAPSENSSHHSSGESQGTHSELPSNRRSLFVRISGLIDSRLSRDTVAGNPYLATGIAILFGLLGAFGVWRLWQRRWLSGACLVLLLLLGPPMLFSIP